MYNINLTTLPLAPKCQQTQHIHIHTHTLISQPLYFSDRISIVPLLSPSHIQYFLKTAIKCALHYHRSAISAKLETIVLSKVYDTVVGLLTYEPKTSQAVSGERWSLLHPPRLKPNHHCLPVRHLRQTLERIHQC